MNKHLDTLNYKQLVNIFAESNKDVIKAYNNLKKDIIQLAKQCVKVIKKNGRIFYVGAGSSGRIALLDALDILPTFGELNWFKYSMAGGDAAILASLEGYEDDYNLGYSDAKKENINNKDLIIGLSASGNTKYIKGFFVYAKTTNAKTTLIANQKNGDCESVSDDVIVGDVGKEVISGSTRLKAATLQKLILNTISSITAIKLGKVYDDLMIDLIPKNEKLVKRSIDILKQITHISALDAQKLYSEADQNIKVAAIMHLNKVDKINAIKLLKKSHNNLREVIG
ncbi:N-acetylmuramic acid 6-phosphate etherase [Mycoplasma sp. 394]